MTRATLSGRGAGAEVTYRELVAAAEAGVIDGDPRRPYLVLQPGFGNGMLVDWQTLVVVWVAFWHVLDKIDVALSVSEKAQNALDKLRNRAKDAAPVVEEHFREWDERGGRPDNVDALLGRRPWHEGDLAQVLGCTPGEACAFLAGAGYARDSAGLWRRGEDEEAELLHGNLELAIQTAMNFEREAIERILRERVEKLLESGEAPELDWDTLVDLPYDDRGFREESPGGLEDDG